MTRWQLVEPQEKFRLRMEGHYRSDGIPQDLWPMLLNPMAVDSLLHRLPEFRDHGADTFALAAHNAIIMALTQYTGVEVFAATFRALRASRKGHCSEDAAGLTSEFFVVHVPHAAPTYNPKFPARPWLTTLAYRRAVNTTRRQDVVMPLADMPDEGAANDLFYRVQYAYDELNGALDLLSLDEMIVALVVAFRRLSPRERAVFLADYVENEMPLEIQRPVRAALESAGVRASTFRAASEKLAALRGASNAKANIARIEYNIRKKFGEAFQELQGIDPDQFRLRGPKK